MTMRRALCKEGPRPLLAGLLFFALLLRALIPAGFMIGTAASGAPALVICPGMEVAPAVHRMVMPGMAGHHHDPATHREAPCPFGALAAPALPPAPPMVALPTTPPVPVAPLAALHGAQAPSLAAPPPPATGPPASA
jgi:hypothetical protein